jgi:hypothetical protein
MRLRQLRYLQSILEKPARGEKRPTSIPAEFNGHQYAIFLLHVDACIEHALMVQYLFAAYSLGGPGVAPQYQAMVARWQETILGVAKEEMGHLITVQNVLRFLSGPLNFDRQDFPYDADFYPFKFTLERLTLDSLARYIYVEMPPHWSGPWAADVKRRVLGSSHGRPVHPIYELFARMIGTIADPVLVPDAFLVPESVDAQATWNEWGRGYSHGDRGSALQSDRPLTPDLIIRTVGSRAEAVSALRQIAQQGESPESEMLQNSHFERFLDIYKEWTAVLKKDKDFDPARPVVTNPVVEDVLDPTVQNNTKNRSVITAPVTFYWAHLQNLRYRLLLSALQHALHLFGAVSSTSTPTARGDVLTLIFSEMYKIRSLASVLVQLPVRHDIPVEEAVAGPPFQMPYTMDIPLEETDRWRWHRDMLLASCRLYDQLDEIETDPRRRGYIAALRQADVDLILLIERIIGQLVRLEVPV